ncbi:zinc ribbon domain-containing protein [Thermosulfuriphilus ammonigenes]|uniref:Zinc ribbon domain-containing protein n=1 Tax=Thermosulfuriphilus ammonigenes TaxID=1936021 RepID=A0A6G7PW48_9BACT|nr:zinc ribbon domain-containing protein [Thermosulfuriphilus ammonigenes]MBA2847896.1 putative FmdB family regulatory protein [Thermosulfuriphilus ammonigenes]QIJ71909.1 zinc ribbon domain-containing protein [Thermosulfuriphilus ammonigenes]
MPIYEFECQKCHEIFEELVLGSSSKVRCPKCQSEDVRKCLSAFAFKSGSRFVSSSGGGCSGCSGGSCSTCH